MKEEAVSPVVAFMLLLMVVVSFISLLNAYYIPSLKQQAEIEHLHQVEQSFLKISSDILQILNFRQNMSMSESVQLGGGDVYFSPLKSSGYLEVNTTLQTEPLVTMSVTSVYNKTINWSVYTEINRTRIIYRPVGNFWINQGYEWEDGIIYVTKGKKSTNLLDDNKTAHERSKYYQLLCPKIAFHEYQNNITDIVIDLVHSENPEHYNTYNGNGACTLNIELNKSFEYPELEKLQLQNGTNVIFSFTEPDTTPLQFSSIINESFTHSCTGKNNVNWEKNTNTLQVPTNTNVTPNLTINKWNLSIHV
jgi:hypothetical protein